MWTYSHPYAPPELTLESIERQAKMGLYRALNIRRIIAMTGSGTTRAVGYPSWAELAAMYVSETKLQIVDCLPYINTDSYLDYSVRTLLHLCQPERRQSSGKSDRNSSFKNIVHALSVPFENIEEVEVHAILDLCDDILKKLPEDEETGSSRLWKARLKIGNCFRAEGTQLLKLKMCRVLNLDNPTMSPVKGGGLDFADEIEQCFDSEKNNLIPFLTDNKHPIEAIPIKTLFSDMGIRRYLTTNYDVQIERHFLLEFGPAQHVDNIPFKALCHTAATRRKDPLRVSLVDGERRAALSATLNSSNIGELVGFVSFSRAYAAQVFHLHGRLDDPDNLVITEDDYRRVYMKTGAVAEAFEEAQQVLFSGNDVLFLGMGMGEEDVLRPLRRFVRAARTPSELSRNVFALLSTHVGENYYEKNTSRAIRLATRYGVQTIYFGGKSYRKIVSYISNIVKFLSSNTSEKNVLYNTLSGQLKDIEGKYKDSNLIFEIEKTQLKTLWIEETEKTNIATAICNELRSRIMSRALVKKLEYLKREQQRWWSDWRTTPEPREIGNSDRYIWKRRYPLASELECDSGVIRTDHLPKFITQIFGFEKDFLNNPDETRIIRIAVRKGGAQGTLMKLISDRRVHQHIFNSTEEKLIECNYTSAFVVHLGFSTEFSSIIEFFSEFILASVERLDADYKISETDCRIHRLDQLDNRLKDYKKLSKSRGQKERLFVCFGGLDLLCDNNGDAFNPMHRAFFRLLTGWTGTAIESSFKKSDMAPIDLLLVSGNTEAPITYLSESYHDNPAEVPLQKWKSYSVSSATKRTQLKWPLMDRLDWDERILLLPFKGISDRDDSEQSDSASQNWRIMYSNDSSCIRHIEEWLQEERNDGRGSKQCSDLYWILEENNGLFILFSTLWRKYVVHVNKNENVLDVAPFFLTFRRRLDLAAARDGISAITEEILSMYQEMDQEENKDKGRFQKLLKLTVNHLAIFSLPVEPWVLMGCPQIEDHFTRDEHGNPHDVHESLKIIPKNTDSKIIADQRWIANFLCNIHPVLDMLCDRGLVVKINPSCHHSGDNSEVTEHEYFLHTRFYLHQRVREYLDHEKGLTRKLGDKRSLYQLSIYCDQPDDLPTPTPNHYSQLSSILNRQVRYCRESLWCAHEFDRYIHVDPENTDPDNRNTKDDNKDDIPNLALTGAAARIYSPGSYSDVGYVNCFGRIHSVPQRLRACYGVIRSSFSISSLTRMNDTSVEGLSESPFDNYSSWLSEIITASVGLSKMTGTINSLFESELLDSSNRSKFPKRKKLALDELEKWARNNLNDCDFPPVQQETSFKNIRPAFYRDEIAWLYNERALSCLMQGRMFETLPLFRIARSIMSHASVPKSDTYAHHAAERRIQLNQAIAHIERGNINLAKKELSELEVISSHIRHSTPSRVTIFARAYLGLCDHIGGNLGLARNAYEEAMDEFQKNGQLRALSIFTRHYADLLHQIGEQKLATEQIQHSQKVAAQAVQRDVQYHAKISEAKIKTEKGEFDSALSAISQSLEYSEKMGLHRLKADALLARGYLALKQGNISIAGSSAALAISICTKNGLRLRKISGLILYGEVQLERNNMTLAKNIFQETKIESERLGYQTKASIAGELLARMK